MLIGELARITGMSKDGIRHYEQLGIIGSRPRQAGSRWYRDYDERAVETIEKVRQAQQLGFSLKEIGPLLKVYGEKPPTKAQTAVVLKERLEVVREKIDTLRDVEAFILDKLGRYEETIHVCPPPKLAKRSPRRQASPFQGDAQHRRAKRAPSR
jgi:MerR family copper efflux transcriptional regulator